MEPFGQKLTGIQRYDCRVVGSSEQAEWQTFPTLKFKK